MLSQKLIELMNDQINKELYSSYLYVAISNYYKEQNLDGFSSWFLFQAKEELEHAEKFMKYLQDEDAKVILKTVEVKEFNFKDLKEPLTFQLAHEKYVTSLIETIYEEAVNTKNYKTQLFLNWFITEQTEEEDTAKELIRKYELLVENKTGNGLYQLDESLKSRK